METMPGRTTILTASLFCNLKLFSCRDDLFPRYYKTPYYNINFTESLEIIFVPLASRWNACNESLKLRVSLCIAEKWDCYTCPICCTISNIEREIITRQRSIAFIMLSRDWTWFFMKNLDTRYRVPLCALASKTDRDERRKRVAL